MDGTFPRPRLMPNARCLLPYLCVSVFLCFPNLAHAQYTEKFEAWSATSNGTWQTKSLAGAPFNVPANAVVEVAVRNLHATLSRSGGLRAVGSSLQRRFDLDEATGGGTDLVTMHVQTDASSQIQHYAQQMADVEFILLGYWNCGTYVEDFQLFNVGSINVWEDENLATHGVGPGDTAEVVIINVAGSTPWQGGIRANGSSLERRILFQSTPDGVDTATMIVKADNTANATVEIYAGHAGQVDFYLVGYWTATPGTYVEKFVDVGSPTADAAWEDIDLTSQGVGDGDVAEFLLSNESTTEENEMGVRANGSSLARLYDLRQNTDGGGDFGRMHVQTDSSAVIDFRHEDVSDTHSFYLLGYWDVGVLLSNHDSGQETDAFKERGAETNAELFSFKLTPCAGGMTVTQVVFRLTSIVGLVNGDWVGVEIVTDSNSNGTIGVGETTTVGGAGSVNTAAGTITFSTSFAVSSATHYILRADFASLSTADQVTIGLAAADIAATQGVTGSTTSVTHKEAIECYYEADSTWTADTADAWETKDLSVSPFNVPANAVVEIAIEQDASANDRDGGVRAVGSSLQRRLLLHKTEAGGVNALVMHVQTNSSSQIQHYGDTLSQPTFHLLGYWTCGTYVERFDTFTAGASGSWQDKNLCAYDVGPGHVAEIVMTNDDTVDEAEAGVRTKGSGLQRRLNIRKGEAITTGVETVTMFVEADTTTGSTIQAYAQDDADISFYVVGYWSKAPLAYTELFADVGSPSANNAWEDVDLTAFGVPDSARAEFVLANEDVDDERFLGVRANGSGLDRDTELHESEDGGASMVRMHVATDSTATMEFQLSNVASTTSFYVVGYWTTCSTSVSYTVTDLGAITGTKSSLGWNLNATEKIAGFEEDSSGNPVAWYQSCGTFTALGNLGGSYAEAHGINNADMVVGWSHIAGGRRRAFSWTSGGGMVNLGVISGRLDSEAIAVNSSSEIVGSVNNFGSPSDNRLAFLYLPSPAYTLGAGMNSLGTLGGTQSTATDINDSGQVVGGAQNGSGNYRPFRWASGTMTNLGTLGGETVRVDHRAEAVNSAGNVAGRSYVNATTKRAFIYDGAMFNLGVLTGGTESWAFGINASQVVVGTSNVTGGAFRAFVWDGANGMRDLNNLISGASGWTLTRATDVNDDGFITGWGTNGSGNVRAFLLTPTCTAGGGGAASVMAIGSGLTDDDGALDELIIDDLGQPLGAIQIVSAEPGLLVNYEIQDLPSLPRTGFAEGLALDRTMKIDAEGADSSSAMTLSLLFTESEIEALGAAPRDLQLHVLTGENGSSPVWRPAGKKIGESAPTNRVGQSGYNTDAFGGVEYWAVRSIASGTFAVGKPGRNVGTPEPARPAPQMCGVAALPGLIFGFAVLYVTRTRRRR